MTGGPFFCTPGTHGIRGTLAPRQHPGFRFNTRTLDSSRVADALRLMEARDKAAQIKRARLQDMIDRGYEDVDAGKVIRLENDDQIDTFFADF